MQIQNRLKCRLTAALAVAAFGISTALAQAPIGYTQGNFLHSGDGVELGYNAYLIPANNYSLPTDVRLGGKYKNFFLGVGLHQRTQNAYYSGQYTSLTGFAVDLGYDWHWRNKWGMNIMVMQVFNSDKNAALFTGYQIENITHLAFNAYKEFDFGKHFFLKPFFGLSAQYAYRERPGYTASTHSKENSIYPFFNAGSTIALRFDRFSIGAMPFVHFLGGGYFGINLSAAYNFAAADE